MADAGEWLIPRQLAVDLPDPFPNGIEFRAAGEGLGRLQHPLAIFDAGEEGLQRIIVAGGDGIELVIVAAGAADGEAQDRVGSVDDDVVEGVLPGRPLRHIVGTDLPRQEHGRGHEKPGRGLLARLTSGDLLADEPVVGQVGVEGRDTVVAVGPGIGPLGVDLVAVRVCVANDVEPVLCIPFAVAWRGKEPLDHPLVGGGRGVGQEQLDLCGRRWQPGQVERRPAQPRAAVSLRRRLQAFGFEPRQDEAVDIVPRPRGVMHSGNRRPLHRLERPVVGLVDGRRRIDAIGPDSAGVHPFDEPSHIGRGQRRHVGLRGGHAHVGVVTPRELHERALVGLAGNDRRPPAVASFESRGLEVETQPAFCLVTCMAGSAVLVEERPDVMDEVRGGGTGDHG